MVGCISFEINKQTLKIIDFIFSCRVLSRNLEYIIILEIINKYKGLKYFISHSFTESNRELTRIFLNKSFIKLYKKKKEKNSGFDIYEIKKNKELVNVKKFF